MNVVRFARSLSVGLGFSLLAALLFSFGVTHVEAQRKAKRVTRIMIVSDGPSDVISEASAAFQRETIDVLEGDKKVEFVQPKSRGAWTEKSVDAAVKEAFSTKHIDVIVGFGPMVGVKIGKIKTLDKPVIIPFAAPALQGLPRNGNVSGRKNLAYITGLLDFESELRQLQELVSFKSIAFIIGEEIVVHLKDANLPARDAGAMLGVNAVAVVAKKDAATTLATIPDDVQGVYIGSILQ